MPAPNLDTLVFFWLVISSATMMTVFIHKKMFRELAFFGYSNIVAAIILNLLFALTTGVQGHLLVAALGACFMTDLFNAVTIKYFMKDDWIGFSLISLAWPLLWYFESREPVRDYIKEKHRAFTQWRNFA